MIQLDDHRKRNLEMMFQNTTDKELIHELIRRGRLRQIQASVGFWPEMRDVDNGGYMDSITSLLLHTIVKNLDTAGCLLKTERPATKSSPEDILAKQTILTADVILLQAREKSGE